MLMVLFFLMFFIMSGVFFYLLFIKPAEPESVHSIPTATTPSALTAEAAHYHG
ncbi:hypothetical protein [Falsibacillus pallidus]|uniref:hypothetical protein n=1 Tax=Falsibacillus pallidus TaxID=493781 RepID=UPI003D96DA4B